jgi:uncharacterized Fe-S center protein
MPSTVYLIRTSAGETEKEISQKTRKLFTAGGFKECFRKNDYTAVKIHVGEAPNNTYIKAGCMKGLVDELVALKAKPFLTDTSTLYSGRRHNAIDHAILAAEHGFCVEKLGIPFIAPDGLFGTNESAVKINGVLNKKVFIADDILRCQSILSIAHFTGHIAVSAAGTLKTLGMGCASRKGKMRQHAALKPVINENCVKCGQCVKHCPADAITMEAVKAHIDADKCIGCAECLAVCRFDAVQYDWGAKNTDLQKNIAEHALGALKDKEGRAVFFNFLINITKDCDCYGMANMGKIVEDIGIAASADPVAVDKATLDLVEEAGGKPLAELLKNDKLDPSSQFEHAERIGLGSTDYKITEVK